MSYQVLFVNFVLGSSCQQIFFYSSAPLLFMMKSQVDIPNLSKLMWKQTNINNRTAKGKVIPNIIQATIIPGINADQFCSLQRSPNEMQQKSIQEKAAMIITKNQQQLSVPMQLLIQLQWWSKFQTHLSHSLQCFDVFLTYELHASQQRRLANSEDNLWGSPFLYQRIVGSTGSIDEHLQHVMTNITNERIMKKFMTIFEEIETQLICMTDKKTMSRVKMRQYVNIWLIWIFRENVFTFQQLLFMKFIIIIINCNPDKRFNCQTYSYSSFLPNSNYSDSY